MKKIATTIASMALIANMVLPTFALASSTDLEIVGNGSDSHNTTNVTSTSTTAVTQTNEASISNNVNASSSTGNNTASKNTGGAVSVDTGNSKTLVAIENAANSNTANVTNCNCSADALVKIAGNGADSKNDADLKLTDTTIVTQYNDASIKNKVNADSSTGDNKANRNTGGDVDVSTGDAVTHVDLTTHANSNAASVGGTGHGSDVSLIIAGNGADSRNDIWLALDRDAFLTQTNSSSVNNYVDATSSTGENRANRNTGGNSSIDTGDAFTGVAVDNAANFNWANIDCDCLTSVTAKVADNGADTHNKIKAHLDNVQNVLQDNSCGNSEILTFGWDGFGRGHKCGINNNLDASSETGDNKLKENTGNPGGDPEVSTGNSETLVGAENSGNSNIFGQPTDAPHGEWDGLNVNVTFNLSDLLAALGLGSH